MILFTYDAPGHRSQIFSGRSWTRIGVCFYVYMKLDNKSSLVVPRASFLLSLSDLQSSSHSKRVLSSSAHSSRPSLLEGHFKRASTSSAGGGSSYDSPKFALPTTSQKTNTRNVKLRKRRFHIMVLCFKDLSGNIGIAWCNPSLCSTMGVLCPNGNTTNFG